MNLQDKLRDQYEIQIILGKDKEGNVVIKMLDNLLISGHTSSGKSMFLNSIIYTILNTSSSEELELVLIDTKLANFYIYEGIKYLKGKVNHTVDESVAVLEECLSEIERRKRENIRGPFVVVLIDEFADLVIQNPKSEELICKIAREGEDVGIYIILSSSKASKDVFTEKIKESIPKRLIGSVASREESLWLLDEEGAEELLGSGDMIFKDMNTGEKARVQTPFVSTEESEQIVQSILENRRIDNIYRLKDILYEDAKKAVIESGNATASFLQRHFKIGYNQSIRLIDQLELNGVIGPKDGVKKREILRKKQINI